MNDLKWDISSGFNIQNDIRVEIVYSKLSCWKEDHKEIEKKSVCNKKKTEKKD